MTEKLRGWKVEIVAGVFLAVILGLTRFVYEAHADIACLKERDTAILTQHDRDLASIKEHLKDIRDSVRRLEALQMSSVQK